MFFSPLRKCLPFECSGHRKKVSDKREFLGSWGKTTSLTSAIHPIHDKDDGNSSKNQGKLRECHLWEGVELLVISLSLASGRTPEGSDA
jgi:hypothetical protein